MIRIEGIGLEFLDLLQNRAIKVQLPIENDKLLTRASGLIYQGKINFSGNVVFLGFISDEYLFELVNFFISHNREFLFFVKNLLYLPQCYDSRYNLYNVCEVHTMTFV